MKNIDVLVNKIKEAPFSTEGDRMMALAFLDEALTKCRADVDKTALKQVLSQCSSKISGFSSAPLEM